MTYDYYRIFYYVGQYRSFTKAALAMGGSQPNVTRAMNNLEAELNCRLMQRSRNGIILTPEGEQLWLHARAAFEQLQAGVIELERHRDLLSGVLSIGASEIALHELLLSVLRDFRGRYPGVKLRISNHSTPQAVAAVQSGGVELALVSTPTGIQKPLQEIPVNPFQEILIAGSSWKELTERQMKLSDLVRYPLICLGRETGTFRFYEALFAAHGCVLSPQIEAATTDQILPMVKHDLGLGFVPNSFAKDAIAAGEVFAIPLADMIPMRSICLVWNTERPVSAVGQVFMEMIQTV